MDRKIVANRICELASERKFGPNRYFIDEMKAQNPVKGTYIIKLFAKGQEVDSIEIKCSAAEFSEIIDEAQTALKH